MNENEPEQPVKRAGDLTAGFMSNIKPLPPEEEARRAKARDDEAKRQHWEKVLSIREGWDAPERHATMKSAEVDTSGPWGETFATLVKRSNLSNGFLIGVCGVRGNGKTQLGVGLMKHTTQQLKSAKFVTAGWFFLLIKATYHPSSSITTAEQMLAFSRPHLLVIDEFGKRAENDWEQGLLFELINRRYNAMKDTLLIDNRTRADFELALGDSLAGRMRETGGIIECNWPSFRK